MIGLPALPAPSAVPVALHQEAETPRKAAWELSGVVLGPAAQPLSGIRLTRGDRVFQTDAKGRFRISVEGPEAVEVGSSVLIVGFPLGFHDQLHHLPVVRQSVIASAFGIRFQGQGYFLTDARTHRGTSGAPVVMRDNAAAQRNDPLPWKLLGVHSEIGRAHV